MSHLVDTDDGSHALTDDEVQIVSAVLDLSDKTIGSIMTPIEDVYTLSLDDLLTEAKVQEIVAEGHSRIPVHTPGKPNEFVGMLSEYQALRCCPQGTDTSVYT